MDSPNDMQEMYVSERTSCLTMFPLHFVGMDDYLKTKKGSRRTYLQCLLNDALTFLTDVKCCVMTDEEDDVGTFIVYGRNKHCINLKQPNQLNPQLDTNGNENENKNINFESQSNENNQQTSCNRQSPEQPSCDLHSRGCSDSDKVTNESSRPFIPLSFSMTIPSEHELMFAVYRMNDKVRLTVDGIYSLELPQSNPQFSCFFSSLIAYQTYCY